MTADDWDADYGTTAQPYAPRAPGHVRRREQVQRSGGGPATIKLASANPVAAPQPVLPKWFLS